MDWNRSNRRPGPASGHSPAPLVQLTVPGDKARLMPPSHTACISAGALFPHCFGRVGLFFFAREFRSAEGELNNGAKTGFLTKSGPDDGVWQLKNKNSWTSMLKNDTTFWKDFSDLFLNCG